MPTGDIQHRKNISWWPVRHAPVVEMTTEQGVILSPKQKFIGQMDFPCDSNHPDELKKLIARLPENALLITGSLKRAQQTADALLAHGLVVKQRLIDAAFNEQHFGTWQGMDYDSHYRQHPQFWQDPAAHCPPDGESFADVCARVAEAVRRHHTASDETDIILITHAGSIRALLALAWGLTPAEALQFTIAPLSLSRAQYQQTARGQQWQVHDLNGLGVS